MGLEIRFEKHGVDVVNYSVRDGFDEKRRVSLDIWEGSR